MNPRRDERRGGGQPWRGQPQTCKMCGRPSQGICQPCREAGQQAEKLLDSAAYTDYLKPEHQGTEWVDKWPNGLAILFAMSTPGLTKGQLRAFYGEVKRLEASAEHRTEEQIATGLRRLKPLAHARQNRGRVPEKFRRFIDVNVDAVGTKKEFERFVVHFEAVTAYCEGRLKEGQ